MRLVVEGFRCYDNYTVSIDDNRLTNLSGSSGIGKSTIFSAIFWCLFGSEAVRNVEPHIKKAKRTMVTMYLDNFVIKRMTNPKLLTVSTDSKVYEDAVAQSIIDRKFGSKKIWECSSYLAQNDRNTLISGSNKDKMTLVNNLTFFEENIEEYLDKILTYTSTLETNVESKNKYYMKELEELESIESKVMWESYVPMDSRIEFYKSIKELEELIPEMERRIRDNNQLIGKKKTLESRLEFLNSEIVQLSSVLLEDKDKIKADIENIELCLKNKQRIDEMEKIKKELDTMTEIGKNEYTTEDLLTVSRSEKVYNDNSKLCKDLNIEYNKEIIKDRINESEKIIDSVPNMKIGKEARELRSKILGITFPSETSLENLEKIREEIRIINESQKTVKCPNCKSNLRINGNVLSTVERFDNRISEIPVLMNRMNGIVADLQRKELKEALQRKLDNLGDKYIDLPDPPNDIKIKEIYTSINRLKSIVFIDRPSVSSEFIKKAIRKNELISRYVFIPKMESEYTLSDLNLSKDKLMKILKGESMIISYKEQRESCENELKSIVIESLENYLDGYKKQLSDLMKTKEDWKLADFALEKRAKLESDKNSLENDMYRLACAKELKAQAIALETKTLQVTVDHINSVINQLLIKLFDDPISIKFNVNRSVTKTGRNKSELGLTILYKGGEYDNVSSMSGGEGDRVSLALTLALNQVSGSPFLLLDETMTSLNAEIQERCLESIKEFCKKTVVCINHESIEGYYDTILALK